MYHDEYCHHRPAEFSRNKERIANGRTARAYRSGEEEHGDAVYEHGDALLPAHVEIIKPHPENAALYQPAAQLQGSPPRQAEVVQ